VKHYERRLPHWDVVGQPLFITFRLHDSLPLNRAFPPDRLTNGKAFVAMDRILDQAGTGAKHLAIREIAAAVVASVRDGDHRFLRYKLHSFVVMPNHVHLLVTPNVQAIRWLGPLKGFTAYQANRILGFTGKPFWQHKVTITWSGRTKSLAASGDTLRTTLYLRAWPQNQKPSSGRVHTFVRLKGRPPPQLAAPQTAREKQLQCSLVGPTILAAAALLGGSGSPCSDMRLIA
jgi:REP element-mobilizing transposase RayT